MVNSVLRRSLRPMLGWVSKVTGYELRRAGSIGRTMQDALIHLRQIGLRPNTIIDVGVGHGTPELYSIYPEPTYLLVDANSEFEPSLKALVSKQLRGQYVIAAAGSRSGSATLISRGEGSSLYREVDQSDASAEAREVRMTTLDSLCLDYSLSGPYLLKIDVQGAELAILAGAEQTLVHTDAIILETSFIQLLEGIPIFADVIEWMNDCGFTAYDVFRGDFRPVDGALAQLDLAFVRTNGQFRQYRGYRSSSAPLP
jgi:FkbM family methyltransferase